MRLLPRTLFVRIALIFTLLVILLSTAQFLIVLTQWTNVTRGLRQQINWELAEHYAVELQPLLAGGFDFDLISRELRRLSRFHPEADVFILDNIGKVISWRHPLRKYREPKVNLKDIETFLTPTPTRKLPLFTMHPIIVDQPVTFSAARVRIGKDIGYVFVALQSAHFARGLAGARDVSLLLGGAIYSGVLIVITAVLGAILFYFVTRRFRALTTAVHEIAEGNLDRRVTVRGDDEVSALGQEVNQMADTIVENIGALKETDKARRDLVADISHELGGPLSSMEGYLELLLVKSSGLSEAEKLKYLETALRNTKSLKRLSNELLQLAKLEARDIAPQTQAFSLLETISEEVVLKYEQAANERGITITVEHQGEVSHVNADPALIEQVVSNLLENAIHYGTENGKITISISESKGHVRVEVADDGIGIAKSELPHIFKRFYRVDSPKTAKTKGTGLGLAIVKKILEAHDSSIEVESHEGEGTSFSFALRVYQEK